MAEQERDEAAELKARNEEKKQETAQLLKLQRQEVLVQLVAPSNVLGLLSLYVVFVGTVVGFGVLAFYTGHKITQEIVFFLCIILFLILPIGAIWYLRPLFTKKDALGKRLLDKLKQSSLGSSLARLGNDRRLRLFNLALYTFMIYTEIRQFPLHPRFSLAMVVLYMAFGFASVILWVAEALERKLYSESREVYERILKVLEIIEGVRDMGINTLVIAESSRKYIEGTEPSHNEAHKAIVDALNAIDHTTRILGNRADDPTPPTVDAPSEEAATSEDDDVL